ncbi:MULTISPECIES: hypothetical protein [Bradyrhizobium]|uniref:Uncharacterized protein n=2 Tax=Bradyrhizobium TaxID=374 RepID=A0ABY0QF89_9BRAD|nr:MULTISPECIES: hypothetical protein [Bradyrhizobium]SDK14400.1 hypothetical protein SAMN05444163_7349 [Bradyrhizobium ottawaense]SEE50816.1 hypothetical protein SAMN05444171_7782 [Bradyrhizobium lablabi]
MARPGANPFQPKQPPLSQRQRELWGRLNKCIMANGGWIVSQADVSPIRFEAPLNSELPELLRQAGHWVIDNGTHERLMPITETLKEHGRNNTIKRQQVGVGIVNVWQFDLPPIQP